MLELTDTHSQVSLWSGRRSLNMEVAYTVPSFRINMVIPALLFPVEI